MSRHPDDTPRPARSGRFSPPRRLKVTPSGRVYILLTFGMGFAALNTGNNLLYLVLGFLLSLIVASGVLSERCVRNIRVRRLCPTEAWADEPFALRYALETSSGTSFAIQLEEHDAGIAASTWVPTLTTQPTLVRTETVARARGPLHLDCLRITTTYPLGIFAKSRDIFMQETLWIGPRRVPPGRELIDDRGQQAGETSNPFRRGGNGELMGLRELQENEDARRVHWRKSAAAGRWLVVEREREDRREFILTVPPGAPGPQLDRACEDAGALSRTLIQQGHQVGLRIGDTLLPPRAGLAQEREIHLALARVGFETERGGQA